MSDGTGSIPGTLLLVGLVAVGAAALVTASYEFSRDRIIENERAQLLERLHSVVDPEVEALNPNPVPLSVTSPELLGTDEEVDVFVTVHDGEPLATIIAPVAPDGYNAPIRLLVGIAPDGTLTGVRVLSHRETPGLGDAIEAERSDWIRQFDGASLTEPPREQWAVDKDDGAFDSLTGATVTPRAVVRAVRRTLEYYEMNRSMLFDRALEADAAMESPSDE